MRKMITRILKILKVELQQYKNRHKENLTTGISFYESERINRYPTMQNGSTTIFKTPFLFSDKSGFLHSLQEIFAEETYKFFSEKEDPLIIDCGANIGLSILYFKKLFPKSTILAFEPDEKIFQLLEKNIAQINKENKITAYKKAVWTSDTDLSFFSEGSLAGSSVTDCRKKNNVVTVKAVDLKKYLSETVDFLKIDIEGAENEVIFDIAPLLPNIKNLFLEYHGISDKSQNLGEILNILKHYGFQYYIRVAAETMHFPFCEVMTSSFNQQLNIFCYREEKKI